MFMVVLALHLVLRHRQAFVSPQAFKLLAYPVIGRGTAIEISFHALKFPDQIYLGELAHCHPCIRIGKLIWFVFFSAVHNASLEMKIC
jgi:hypothetical protein